MALDLQNIESTLMRTKDSRFKVVKPGESILFAIVSDKFPKKEFDFNGKKIKSYYIQICELGVTKTVNGEIRRYINQWSDKPVFLHTPRHLFERLLEALIEKGEVVFNLSKDYSSTPFPRYDFSIVRKINKKDRKHLDSLTLYKEIPSEIKEEIKSPDEIEVLMKKIGYQIAHLA